MLWSKNSPIKQLKKQSYTLYMAQETGLINKSIPNNRGWMTNNYDHLWTILLEDSKWLEKKKKQCIK